VGVGDEVGGVDRKVRKSGGYDEGLNGASVRQSPCRQSVGEDEHGVGNVDVTPAAEKCVVCEGHGTLPPDEGGQTCEGTNYNLCWEEASGVYVLKQEKVGMEYSALDKGQ